MKQDLRACSLSPQPVRYNAVLNAPGNYKLCEGRKCTPCSGNPVQKSSSFFSNYGLPYRKLLQKELETLLMQVLELVMRVKLECYSRMTRQKAVNNVSSQPEAPAFSTQRSVWRHGTETPATGGDNTAGMSERISPTDKGAVRSVLHQ